MKSNLVFCSILSFLLINNNSIAQKKLIGVEFNCGYRSIYHGAGVGINYRIYNRLDLILGYCGGTFNGIGYTSGFRYVICNKSWQPYIGAHYSKTFGKSFFLIDGENKTHYKINNVEFYYGDLGIMKKVIPKDPPPKINAIFLFSLNLSYRYTSYTNKLIYLDGHKPYIYEDKFNKRIGNGIGISFSWIILLSKKTDSNPLDLQK